MLTTSKFKGIDVYSPKGDMQPGSLSKADNAVIRATEILSRPAFQGCLTTAHTNPIYTPFPYLKSDGSTGVIYSSGGKIYQYTAGDTADTEILNRTGNTSFNINSPTFRQARLGLYDYMVDGSGPLIRTSLAASTAEYTTGQAPPTVAPVASLTDLPIDTPKASDWNAEPSFNPTVTTTTATFTIAAGSGQVIHVASVVPFVQYQYADITDGTHIARYYITAIGSTTITCTYVATATYSTSGTMGNPANVNPTTMIGNGDFLVANTTGGENLPGDPWTLTNGPYSLNTNSPDYGPFISGASQQQYTNPTTGFTYPFSLLLDNPADSIGQTFLPISLATTTIPVPGGLTKGYQYLLTGQIQSQSRGSQATLAVILNALNISGGVIASVGPINFTPGGSSGNWTAITYLFSLGASLAALGSDPHSYQLVLLSGPKNVAGNGVWIADLVLAPAINGPILNNSGTNQVEWAAPYPQVNGTYIVRDYGSGGTSRYSDVGILSIPASTSLPTADFAFRVGFCAPSSTTIEWTNSLNWSTSASYVFVDITTVSAALLANVRYLYIEFIGDLASTDNPNGSNGIWIFGPLTNAGQLVVSSVANGLNAAGYFYFATELSDVDNGPYVPQMVNPIESDPGPVSNTISPTAALATGQVVLPAKVNTATTFMSIYRGGGEFAAALGSAVLIATVPLFADYGPVFKYTDLVIDGTFNTKVTSAGRPFSSADIGLLLAISGGVGFTLGFYVINSVSGVTATLSAAVGVVGSTGGTGNLGDALNRDNKNPFITWDHTTRTLIDDTPDGFLFNAEIMQYGREQPPVGAQCVCSWNNSLWLAVDSTLEGSWNVVADQEAGLYFTTVDLAGDPNLIIKGITLGVGAGDNDKIQALVPVGNYLFVFKQYSVWILTGTDPTNYSIFQYAQTTSTDSGGGAGIGLMAPRCAAVQASEGPNYTPLGISFNHVMFLAADGVYAFDGAAAKPSGIQLNSVLNFKDASRNTLIPPASMKLCAMSFCDHGVFLMAPETFEYTDLIIDPSNNKKITSLERPFRAADVGGTLTQIGGTGFNLITNTISSVVAGAAIMSSVIGTVGSTGGFGNYSAAKNTIIYLFNSWEGGWTRLIPNSTGFTSGGSLCSASDSNDMYLGGYDGQLYKFGGEVDKLTPADTGEAISLSILTRGMGQEGEIGQPWFALTRPTDIYIDVIDPKGNVVWAMSVVGNDENKVFTRNYTTAPGENAWRTKCTPGSQGQSVQVGLSASVTFQVKIRAIGLDVSKGTAGT